MCFSFLCNLNSNKSESVSDPILTEVQNNCIILKGYGRTIRYKTNISTIWKDIRIVYNRNLGTFDGIGISVFNRKEYIFLLIGNIEQTVNNQILLKIKKIHPSIENDTTHSNCIEYTGTYYTSNTSEEVEKNMIYLVSHQSSGYLQLKIA